MMCGKGSKRGENKSSDSNSENTFLALITDMMQNNNGKYGKSGATGNEPQTER